MQNEIKLDENFWKECERRHKRGKVVGGILVVIIGLLFLGRELGVIIPTWLFSWKTLIIAIGLVIGIKHGFKSFKWLIPVGIGVAFLVSDLYPELIIKPLLWPILIIFIGLVIIFKPRRKYHHRFKRKMYRRQFAKHWEHKYYTESVNDDELDFTTFMGSVKKNIVSKNFKGGDVTNVFGGIEINLSQADFENSATLEITTIFGGTTLIVPANWEIKSEITCAMGNVEDKRIVQTSIIEEKKKILILKGTVFMGGIEIKSY